MKNLLKSLAEFQNEVPVIHKGKEGYGYSYADLPTIFEVINPLLKKHGLGFYQAVTLEGLLTVVFHIESGEMIQSMTEIQKGVTLKGMNDFQVLGSAITYLRRYALSAILGLVTEKDGDAAGRNKGLDENELAVWESQIKNLKTVDELESYWKQNITVVKGNKQIVKIFTNRKAEINGVQGA